MDLRPDLVRTIAAMRQQRAQWEQMAGETVTINRGPYGQDGHPTLPHPCQCPRPVHDDGTCVRCGKGLP
jgi:hypothetical protein